MIITCVSLTRGWHFNLCVFSPLKKDRPFFNFDCSWYNLQEIPARPKRRADQGAQLHPLLQNLRALQQVVEGFPSNPKLRAFLHELLGFIKLPHSR